MQCTAEQIEEKKRLAQNKLAQKYGLNSPNKSFSNSSSTLNAAKSDLKQLPSGTNSPKAFKFKPYDKPTSALSFYGKASLVTASCYLISESRFAVDLNGYSSAAIDVFKTIPSRNYSNCFHVYLTVFQ